MKITKTFGDLVFEIEHGEMGQCFDELKKLENNLEKLYLNPEKRKQNAAIGIGTSTLRMGDPGDMSLWIQAEDKPHAESWICKHSGFSNAKALLRDLERVGDLKWHECLYKGSNGHWQTMKGAFLDGATPPERSVHLDDLAILRWVRENPGHMSVSVEKNCGVIRSEARRILARLIADGELEMRTHATKPEKFGVWVV